MEYTAVVKQVEDVSLAYTASFFNSKIVVVNIFLNWYFKYSYEVMKLPKKKEIL